MTKLKFMSAFALAALLWASTANAQVCGNMPIGPDREDCRLDKIQTDIRASDLAGSRARAEVERLRSDIMTLRDMAIDEPVIDPPMVDEPVDPPSSDTPAVDDNKNPPSDDTSAAIPDMSVKIGDIEITLSKEMDPWIDGTRIYIGDMAAGFRLMAFVHPQHQRWVVQYQPKLGRLSDGFKRHRHGPYTAEVLLDGEVLAAHSLTGHASGQEWTHEVGRRAFIRTVEDLEAMGHLPVHVPPSDMKRETSGPKPWPVTRQIIPANVRAMTPYSPLDPGPLVYRMSATGSHPEVHWTNALAKLAGYDDLSVEERETLLENVRISAESFGVFTYALEDKDDYRPADVRKPYYAQSNDVRVFDNIADTLLNMPDGGVVTHEKYTRDSTMDVAHIASPSWEWFALTGDPYHLRMLQHTVNTTLIRNRTPERKRQGLDRIGLVPERHQPRGWAKATMLIWRVHELTPQGDWDWLLPKAYWAQSIKDTGEQSQWLATLPDISIMEVPRDYTSGFNRNTADAISHIDMQALWSAGWMVFHGYDDFRPLYEALKKPLFEAYAQFGPAMVRGMPNKRQAWFGFFEREFGGVATFKELRGLDDYFSHTDEIAIKYSRDELKAMQLELGRSLKDEEKWRPDFVAFMETHRETFEARPVDLSSLPENPFRTAPRRSLEVYHTIVFAEERFEGVLASLIQFGDESLRPMHDRLMKARDDLRTCASMRKYPVIQYDIECPYWDFGINGRQADWSFKTDMSALVKITFADAPTPVAPTAPVLSDVATTQTGVTIGLTDPNSGLAQETQTVLEIYDNSGLTGSAVLSVTLAADTTQHEFASGLTAGADYWATATVSNSAGDATAITLPFTTDAAAPGLTMPSVTGTPVLNADKTVSWTPSEAFALVFVSQSDSNGNEPITGLTCSDGSVSVTLVAVAANDINSGTQQTLAYSLSGVTTGVQVTLSVSGGQNGRVLIVPVPIANAGAGVIAAADSGNTSVNDNDLTLTINTTGSDQTLALFYRTANQTGTFSTDGNSVEIASSTSIASQNVTLRELEIPVGASVTETITGTSDRRPTGIVVAVQDAP